MRIAPLFLAAAGLCLSTPSFSAGPGTLVPGFFDTSTGAFTPLVMKRLPSATVAATGTIKIVVTLALESAVPADEPVTCNASASASDSSFFNTVSGQAGAVRTGNTGVCTIILPYDWTLSASTDTVTVSFSASAGQSYGSGSTYHSTSHSFAAFTVPANGTVTTLTLSDSL